MKQLHEKSIKNNNPFSDLVDFLTSHSHRMERATVLRTNIVFFLGLQLKWNSTKDFSRSCNQLEWGYDLSGLLRDYSPSGLPHPGQITSVKPACEQLDISAAP